MSSRLPPQCPHELRPGTVTCLYCSRDAREAARKRWISFGGRAVAFFAVALVLISAGSDMVVNMRAKALAAATLETPIAEAAVTVARAEPMPAPAAAEPEPYAPVRPATTPRVPEGRTLLREGVHVERVGARVVVHFDTPMLRTRRADKFERMVRETLPRVHGAVADSLLDAVAPGTLALEGDLLYDLPARGIHLPAIGAPVLSIFPETRPGRDGPLVVAYRITAGR